MVGGSVGSARLVRILAMESGSKMAASSRLGPWQCGQVSASTRRPDAAARPTGSSAGCRCFGAGQADGRVQREAVEVAAEPVLDERLGGGAAAQARVLSACSGAALDGGGRHDLQQVGVVVRRVAFVVLGQFAALAQHAEDAISDVADEVRHAGVGFDKSKRNVNKHLTRM